MSSYIKFMFKYLFEPEALPAELLANGDGLATQRAPTGKVDVVFVLDSDGQPRGDVVVAPPLVGPSSSQLPVNYSSSYFASSTSSSSSSFSSSDNMTRPHEASSLSSSPSIMVNKSLVDAAAAGTRRLVSVSGRAGQAGWLQQAEQLQLQSADSGAGNSKLWPPNCLGFARMFAMAQNSQQHNANGGGGGSGAANGTTTTTTTTTTTMVSSNNSNGGGGLLAARLGSFAEFEHLIRRQLAAVARGIGNSTSAAGPLTSTLAATATSGDGNSQRGITGITSAFYSPSSPLSSGQQAGAGNLVRLLIRSIGHANATTTTTTTTTTSDADQLEFSPRERTMLIQQHTGGPTSTNAPVPLQPEPVPEPAAVQVNSLELLECYNQLQLNDYYQGYDIFIGLRIASTLSILFIVFILFVIYKTGCRDGERTSRSQLRLTSSGNGGDKSGSPQSSASTNSLVNKQRPARRRKEKYQAGTKRKKKKINSTCGGSGGTGIESQPSDPYQCDGGGGSFANNNARADTCYPLEARTNKDNQGRSWSPSMNDETLIKQQLPSECPSVMVVIEDDSSSMKLAAVVQH